LAQNKNPEYKFWNGKNVEGGSKAGDKDLISEGARKGKTAAKYAVSNDTVSGKDLQKR
jgi:hypothetical protein